MNECAIADADLIEHGTTSIPSVLNEPDEIEAARSPSRWTTSANASKSAAVYCVSSSIVWRAWLDITKCTSTSGTSASAWSVP